MSDPISDDLNLQTDPEIEEAKDPTDHKKKKTSPFLLLLSILMTGTAGWKELRRARMTPEKTAAGCLYPLAALAAVCKFADWFNKPEFNLSETLVGAASIFASFFFSYFAVIVICRLLFPYDTKQKTETPYFKQIVQYALSSLALFSIPSEILPILEPITVFLPIWTAFIVTKGIRFLMIPDQFHNRCMVTLIVTAIVTPYFFIWVCDNILL